MEHVQVQGCTLSWHGCGMHVAWMWHGCPFCPQQVDDGLQEGPGNHL